MTRRRNTNSRKPQQSANGAHSTFRKTGTGPHLREDARKSVQDQDQVVKEGRGRSRHSDRRSMSPGQGDSQGEQQAHHRDNNLSRTPLAARTTYKDPTATHKARGSAIRHEADQVPAKRKREADDDNKQHAYKKAHTDAREMQPAAVTKPLQEEGTLIVEKDQNSHDRAADSAAIIEMSEEERRKFRNVRFKPTYIGPGKAAVAKAASHEPRNSAPMNSIKYDHKAIRVRPTKPVSRALTPHAPNWKSEPSLLQHSGASTKVAVLESSDAAVIEVTAINPKSRQQNTSRIVSKTQVTEVDECKETVATANSSTASSKADLSPTKRSKRKQLEVEDVETIPAKKTKKPETAKVNVAAVKRRNEKIKQSLADQQLHADQNRFPEEGITFVNYDAYSIPLLCSHSIEHGYPFKIMDRPSEKLKRSFDNESETEIFSRKMLVLRQEALRLSRKRFWTSEDLGRKITLKSEPPRVISDCDLYLYDGKVYVATEQGLLLVAVYLKLIGVPDTQPVRFDGHQPAWMGLITARPERRRVLKTWEPTLVLREGGCIRIMSGSIVVVYEHGIFDIDTTTGEESRMVYGARMDDGVAGWFMYANTCRMDWLEDSGKVPQTTLDPTMIDWAKFDFGPFAARAAAQQAALPTPKAVAQETPTSNRPSVSPQASGFSTPDELVAASPANIVIPVTSKPESESNAESTQPSMLEEETIPLLSIAGGPISRHDSPNIRSDEILSDTNGDATGDTGESQDSTTAALLVQATDARSVIAQETATSAFSKLRQVLPGFERPERHRGFKRDEDVLDWDDSDL
ncbi:hypothetical protein G6011_08898 [Alternaria panax]|uniref:Uncharacterized protein n=1 Tax=Alternaria panax TaxID=48097 RepID=A0AAD4NQD3_9PLEO|nr:hypothetical protein G6011_08898 [Alternaria panax]